MGKAAMVPTFVGRINTMVKFSILLRRKADMSQEDFVHYHKAVHAPLFTSLPEVRRHVRNYVQCHALPVSLPGLPEPRYHGITELWFDDVEAIGNVFSSNEYMKQIRPDEAKFLELHECGFLITVENPVL